MGQISAKGLGGGAGDVDLLGMCRHICKGSLRDHRCLRVGEEPSGSEISPQLLTPDSPQSKRRSTDKAGVPSSIGPLLRSLLAG
jgi:hypothetical protein